MLSPRFQTCESLVQTLDGSVRGTELAPQTRECLVGTLELCPEVDRLRMLSVASGLGEVIVLDRQAPLIDA